MATLTHSIFSSPSPQARPWSSPTPLKAKFCAFSSLRAPFLHNSLSSPPASSSDRRSSAVNPSSLHFAEPYQEEEEEEEEDDDDDDDDFDDVIYVLDSDGDDDDDGVRHNEHGNGSLFSIQSERSVLLDSEDSTDSETPDYPDRFKLQHGREIFQERAYLVGIERKGQASLFGIADSLAELAQLADTAGLKTVGSTYQKLDHPNPKTYIGSGKVAELCSDVRGLDIETVIFDDELSPGQLRSLEKAFGNEVRVCDRTALILDIFSQRAATREATLQVQLAQMEYQLPRLTRMWTHLERQAGGMVKGMGEKQIEVDKRILRTRMALLKKELDSVRGHRQQYRDRRGSVPIPVVSLVGYTNAGKSTLLNRLSGADVLAEDRLFATLDPTTRKIELSNGTECLMTDTVGFIQKLPTQLVASFRATLEEINDSSLLLHVVDISHPLAKEQMEAVERVLAELNVEHIPRLTVWNKIDRADKESIRRAEAVAEGDIARISAVTGEGVNDLCKAIQEKLKETLVWVDVLLPYDKGEFVNVVHRLGVVDSMEYLEDGISLKAHVPLRISRQLHDLRQTV